MVSPVLQEAIGVMSGTELDELEAFIDSRRQVVVPVLTEDQEALVRRRRVEIEDDPSTVVSWPQVRASLIGRYR